MWYVPTNQKLNKNLKTIAERAKITKLLFMHLAYGAGNIIYEIADNGKWKMADPKVMHFGLTNMERRCRQSGFDYDLSCDDKGTRITVGVPVTTYYIRSEMTQKGGAYQ